MFEDKSYEQTIQWLRKRSQYFEEMYNKELRSAEKLERKLLVERAHLVASREHCKSLAERLHKALENGEAVSKINERLLEIMGSHPERVQVGGRKKPN